MSVYVAPPSDTYNIKAMCFYQIVRYLKQSYIILSLQTAVGAHMVALDFLWNRVCVCGISLFQHREKRLTLSFAALSVNKYKFFIDPYVVVTCKIK